MAIVSNQRTFLDNFKHSFSKEIDKMIIYKLLAVLKAITIQFIISFILISSNQSFHLSFGKTEFL
jgi:hypothetical protein